MLDLLCGAAAVGGCEVVAASDEARVGGAGVVAVEVVVDVAGALGSLEGWSR